MDRIKGLSLFSGIGGIDKAVQQWMRTIAYCEIDPYCQGILLSRMADGQLDNAPIWNDVKTLDGKELCGLVDIIVGGFPCQDISVAGLGKGLAGERSGLFYQIVRLCREIKPRFIFLENVPAITSRGGTEVVREIAAMGYDCRWCIISAASVGALHKRERWFLLAYSMCERLEGFGQRAIESKTKHSITSNGSKDVSDTGCQCQGMSEESEWPSSHTTGCNRFWETESSLGKLVDGVSFRVDKLKALGNSVVPQQVQEAFKILSGIK